MKYSIKLIVTFDKTPLLNRENKSMRIVQQVRSVTNISFPIIIFDNYKTFGGFWFYKVNIGLSEGNLSEERTKLGKARVFQLRF